jgi:hypothetical protein
MNLVSDLDLPVFDYTAPDFPADRYHQQLAETSQQGSPAWSGSPTVSPNHGPEPDVT